MRLFRLAVLATALLSVGEKSTLAVAINWPAGLSAGVIPTLTGGYNAGYVFANPTDMATIYVLDPSGTSFLIYTYDPTIPGWDPVEPTFYASQGYFVDTPTAQSFNPLFAFAGDGGVFGGEGGLFAQGPPPLSPNKLSFQGSPTGLPATYEDVFGAPPNDETQLMRFIPGSSDIAFGSAHYHFYYYKNGVWTPETPVLNSLEPAFVIYPYLSIKYTVSGNPPTIDMTWPARGKLEEADSPLGTWHEVTTVGNHHSVTVDPAQGQGKYYRVREGGL